MHKIKVIKKASVKDTRTAQNQPVPIKKESLTVSISKWIKDSQKAIQAQSKGELQMFYR